jgi:hypothetical protein
VVRNGRAQARKVTLRAAPVELNQVDDCRRVKHGQRQRIPAILYMRRPPKVSEVLLIL